jgi:uncharacterized protein YndB with AHSA1/START domain
MSIKNNSTAKTSDLKAVVTRVIQAPCGMVFRAWTDPDQMVKWWSPEKIECRSVTADLKIGGTYRIHMVTDKGDHIAIGKYKQIVPNKRLQFTWQWEHYAMPDSVVTVEFEDLGKKTRLTLTHEGLPDQEDAADHKRGWTSAVKKFAGLMKQNKISDDYLGCEFIITREFDASRELVWKACTEENHLAQWWGPKGFTAPVCEWDVKPGGKIHVVMRSPNGLDFPMGGKFHEIVAPERLVTMTGALDEKGKYLFEILHTMTLAERNGKTKLTMHSRVIKTTDGASRYIGGFETGMTLSLARLAGHLAQKTEPLVIERTLAAPVALVWEAITNKKDISQWSFEMKAFKPVVGCKFQFYGEKDGVKYLHHCKITEVIPQKRLAYSWRYKGYEGDSLVSFDLFTDGKKTRLKLTHLGLETFPKLPNFARKNFAEGWTFLIGQSLKQFVEKQTKTKQPTKKYDKK